jgi:hypothetical protein
MLFHVLILTIWHLKMELWMKGVNVLKDQRFFHYQDDHNNVTTK